MSLHVDLIKETLKPGERLLWCGMPFEKSKVSPMVIQNIMGSIIPFAMGIFVFASVFPKSEGAAKIFSVVFLLFAVGIGVYILLSSFKKGGMGIYAVTTDRVIFARVTVLNTLANFTYIPIESAVPGDPIGGEDVATILFCEQGNGYTKRNSKWVFINIKNPLRVLEIILKAQEIKAKTYIQQ